jgi:hypothetical protein
MRQTDASERLGGMLLRGTRRILRARLSGGQKSGSISQQPDEPAVPEDPAAADAARTALRTFLAGFGLDADERSDLLLAQLLEGARARRHADPDKDLGECAILHAEQEFEAWLGFVLGAEGLAGQPALPIGRAAFLACGGPATWGHLILVHEHLPEAFVAAMRAAAPPLAPLPTPGSMAAQSLESWSIADAGTAVAQVVDANFAWFAHARPLMTVPIKLAKPDS